MDMLQVVHKHFTSGGVYRQSGEVVDASAISAVRLKKLQDQRYLAPYTGNVVTCSKCDRMFSTKELLDDHTLEVHSRGGQEGEKSSGNDKGRQNDRAKQAG
jgi:hypothetical protein